MSEYDNTNRGAAFKPFPEQKFILQGKMQVTHGNIDKEMPVALIMAESQSGSKRIEVYSKIGVLFDNEKNGNDKAPDYSGPLDGLADDLRIAAWREMKGDNAYMSFRVSPKVDKSGEQVQSEPVVSSQPSDDIPF